MFIYVIRAENGPAKIGFARDPAARLMTIKTGCPTSLKLVYILPCGTGLHREVERYIHHQLRAFRVSGEWFKVSDRRAIRAVKLAGARFEPKHPMETMQMIQFPIITPSQARAARAMVGFALREAATKASLGINTLNRFEQDTREEPTLDTAFKIVQFYESHGLEFPDERTVRWRLDQAA